VRIEGADQAMGEPAFRPMEIEAFLQWEGDRDTRYQLRDGVPVAMAPPWPPHSRLSGNLAIRIGNAAEKRPACGLHVEVGLVSPLRNRTYHQADIAVSCAPQPTTGVVADPVLIVEILSPGTGDDDRRIKLPDYRAMPSAQEIVLIDSRYMHREVHRKQADGRWVVDILRDAASVLRLDSVDLEVRLDDVYRNVPMEAA
jgi:Uma2 family endonuclease